MKFNFLIKSCLYRSIFFNEDMVCHLYEINNEKFRNKTYKLKYKTELVFDSIFSSTKFNNLYRYAMQN